MKSYIQSYYILGGILTKKILCCQQAYGECLLAAHLAKTYETPCAGEIGGYPGCKEIEMGMKQHIYSSRYMANLFLFSGEWKDWIPGLGDIHVFQIRVFSYICTYRLIQLY